LPFSRPLDLNRGSDARGSRSLTEPAKVSPVIRAYGKRKADKPAIPYNLLIEWYLALCRIEAIQHTVSTAVQDPADVRRETAPASTARIAADGKFLSAAAERFLVKGVTYGTFSPDAQGYQFPSLTQIAEDFRLISSLGINTVRTYTPPRSDLLDQAARHGLRVMVGLPWSQHVAFLDDRRLKRAIRRELLEKVREFGDHPAVLLVALGNAIPPGVVGWHGRVRVERFLRELYQDAKTASPESLFTYVNFPPTEFLDISFFDVCAFNVYLH